MMHSLKLSILTILLSLAVTKAQIVRSYGEVCFFDIQCNDHRMACHPENNSSSVKRCLCDRMHVWSKERRECLMSMNITAMLATLDITEYAEKIANSDKKVFVGVVIAGITVIILGIMLTLTCIFYGCCLYECFDKFEKLENGITTKRCKCGPSCPGYVPPTAPKSVFR